MRVIEAETHSFSLQRLHRLRSESQQTTVRNELAGAAVHPEGLQRDARPRAAARVRRLQVGIALKSKVADIHARVQTEDFV